MAKDLIKIKGGANGFQLMVDSSAELEAVQQELDRKLAEHPEFFPEGTKFELVVADLNKSVRKGLSDFLVDRGLDVDAGKKPVVQREPRPVRPMQPEPEPEQQLMTVINRTVRNGEEISAKGSVMICGNVNPGAQIIAAGSIDIRGTCRGIVHAGAMGDTDAFVVADRLMPQQIRIANFIARSPDNLEKSSYAEKAYIKNEQIIIEPIER